jgi:ribonucleotide monophosphatase NagD (HAD superfamily)
LATGKPDASIYARALRNAVEVRGHAFERGRVVAIGDTPDLDIAGALAQEFAAVWIASQDESLTGASSSVQIPFAVPWMPALRW